MKIRTTKLACAMAALALSAGCDRRDQAENAPTPQPAQVAPAASPTPAEPAPTEATTDDALALGLLNAVNANEIAAAVQAQEKKVTGKVLDYARMMEKDHGENRRTTESLGSPAQTPEVQALMDKGKAELDALGKRSGKDYETAYVEAMIKGHAEALALIDTRLIPLASSEAVKKHLSQTRDKVAAHLEAANKLKA